jgi:hypothetical protein
MDAITEAIPRRNDCVLMCVDPARVREMWPHVEWLIENALWTGTGDESMDDIRDDVFAARALLWVVWSESKAAVLAAGTTKLIETAQGKVCILSTCAGRDIKQWQSFIADIEEYARREGCAFSRLYGRPGWERILRGYAKPWVTIQKAL